MDNWREVYALNRIIMVKLKRRDAIKILAYHYLLNMSKEKREDVLLEMNKNFVKEDIESEKYNKPILAYFHILYKGVRNTYLEYELRENFGIGAKVCGSVEKLNACPCCNYRTLEERGEYFICNVCKWEDDGSMDLNKISSPNRMTLNDARIKFNVLKKSDPQNINFQKYKMDNG